MCQRAVDRQLCSQAGYASCLISTAAFQNSTLLKSLLFFFFFFLNTSCFFVVSNWKETFQLGDLSSKDWSFAVKGWCLFAGERLLRCFSSSLHRVSGDKPGRPFRCRIFCFLTNCWEFFQRQWWNITWLLRKTAELESAYLHQNVCQRSDLPLLSMETVFSHKTNQGNLNKSDLQSDTKNHCQQTVLDLCKAFEKAAVPAMLSLTRLLYQDHITSSSNRGVKPSTNI